MLPTVEEGVEPVGDVKVVEHGGMGGCQTGKVRAAPSEVGSTPSICVGPRCSARRALSWGVQTPPGQPGEGGNPSVLKGVDDTVQMIRCSDASSTRSKRSSSDIG